MLKYMLLLFKNIMIKVLLIILSITKLKGCLGHSYYYIFVSFDIIVIISLGLRLSKIKG